MSADAATRADAAESASALLRASRRRLTIDAIGIAAGAAAFAVVYGLAARQAGYSLVETSAMSVLLFAGAAQFAAVGLVMAATPWPAIVLLTALLNARHLLYSAALAPWLRAVRWPKRALMAHLLTDEAFALSLSHFQRIGRFDAGGYWIGAIGATFIPWNLATIAGYLGGQFIDSPVRYGIDVVFPAAMAGLCVGLVTGRREVVSVAVAVVTTIGVALAGYEHIAVIAGGIVGPIIGLLMPGPRTPPTERDTAGKDAEIGVSG